ncbi:MAG: hypothetical protein KDI68_08420 [Gammaproteobacteria bacterium]|nr:hypothetical protein [Gammaproteobacteria bacterium]
MKPIHSLIAATTLIAAVSTHSPAFAIDEYNVSAGATRSGERVALRGHDTVALALGIGVIDGHAEYIHVHDGVAYYFASAEARDAFASNPDAYMPQFGGYCAFGVAVGRKLDANPRFADIIDDKLYLFLDAGAFAAYEKDKGGVLAKAKRNWPSMHRVAVAEVNGR